MQKIISSLCKYYYAIRFGNKLKLHNAILRRVKIHIADVQNIAVYDNVSVFDSEFSIVGSGNSFSIDKSPNLISGLSVKIFGEGNRLVIEKGATICGLRIVIRGKNCHVNIGSNFSENINCMIVCMGNNKTIEIGQDCMLSENIDIWNTDSHQITDMQGSIINLNNNVKIGNHVWIGKKASILKGVTIGSDSVVGMSSVVTSDMDNNSIYVGNPARKVHDNINWKINFNLT